MIPNHVTPALSELDLRMARAIPPGGNWRDIPLEIPSERLAQIRVSVAAGEGSRSTYYGRLHPDRPSYTVNTYYNRPGNGCFLHYDVANKQHRTLSHREAARLQSFPDSFVFTGPQRAICQQIGNAVPPLLAFQIARALGKSGTMIDVFAGAGGLSQGFKWAGWSSLAAVDNDRHAIATFNANISNVGFVGDVNDSAVQDRLVQSAALRKKKTSRLALVGGPPCQGFSTGGNRRSTEDVRNSLYKRYAKLVGKLKPDIFVFENVLGLLSLDGGSFCKAVLKSLQATGYETTLWRLNASHFGVPQRRERVIIVGTPRGAKIPSPPLAWTSAIAGDLAGMPVCSVTSALDDLPILSAGEDGSGLPYRHRPRSEYQRVMRGDLTPAEYVAQGLAQRDSSEQSRALRAQHGGPLRVYAG